ncbi:MAG: phosphoenolpyruvate--protein phosphotransferase [Bacteroidales bacterium]|nr:phosphoenolpyruvate--protein phosphotransferase [Bacteroidales bacterium]
MKISAPAFLWRHNVSGLAVRTFEEAFELVNADLKAAAETEWDKHQVSPLEASDRKVRDARTMAAAMALQKPEAASVFATHLEMLNDPMVRESVEAGLAAGLSDLEAVKAAEESICAIFADIQDEYLRARVDDVRDVFRRLVESMCGNDSALPATPSAGHKDSKVVLVAEELLPSDMVNLDLDGIAGIICRRGSPTSHVCIISHSKGIPIQIGVDISGIKDGDIVSVDDPMVGATSLSKLARSARRRVFVNASNIDEVVEAIASGAEGIGLFRSEFFFMHSPSLPSFEEQRDYYMQLLDASKGHPLNLRLLDVGGDKQLPYMPVEKEDNPFMGVRGIRFLLKHRDILETQIAAALSAAEQFPGQLSILIPMVSTVEEVRAVREIMGDNPEGLVRLGVMIETPASVLCAPGLAAECDFFSIGTNDLTQYVMAVDRSNSEVSSLFDPLSPAMCSALAITVDAAHAAGIPVGVCGELASDPRATRFLIDLGVNVLSIAKL